MGYLQIIEPYYFGSAPQSILDTDTSLWLKEDNPLNTNSRWYDSSPNNHVLTGSATLTENVLNGQKGYIFNGTSDYFDGGDILDIGANSRTIYVIAKNASQTVSPYISKLGTGSPGEWFFDMYGGNQYISALVPAQISAFVANSAQTSFSLKRGIIDRTDKKIKSKVNNVEAIQSFNYATNFNCSAPLYVGRLLTYYLSGTICEIIVFDRLLTTNEDTSINDYLTSKYGTL